MRFSPPKILVVPDQFNNPGFYRLMVEWTANHYPDLLKLFRFERLPYRLRPEDNVVLHVPWLQDPVQAWSEEAYALANALAADCDARGVPVSNRVDRLHRAGKVAASETLREVGLRAPLMRHIENPTEFRRTLYGMPLPLFLREDWKHQAHFFRADTWEEVKRWPIESFQRPVACELVDAPSADGLYRKYRYIAFGDIGSTHNLQSSYEWVVRGSNRLYTDQSREEEIAYTTRPDPFEADFQRARRAFGLDMLAFDYGILPSGEPIVWEVNPYPYFKIATEELRYRNYSTERCLACMLHMYLSLAGAPIPAMLTRDTMRYNDGERPPMPAD